MKCDPFDQAFAGPAIDAYFGLTKREYFAGQALAALQAADEENDLSPAEQAEYAVFCADALIEELNK